MINLANIYNYTKLHIINQLITR